MKVKKPKSLRSEYVKIVKIKNQINRLRLCVSSNNDDLFGDNIIINVKEDRVEFSKTTLNYAGRTYYNNRVSVYHIPVDNNVIEICEGYYKLSNIDDDHIVAKLKNLITD